MLPMFPYLHAVRLAEVERGQRGLSIWRRDHQPGLIWDSPHDAGSAGRRLILGTDAGSASVGPGSADKRQKRAHDHNPAMASALPVPSLATVTARSVRIVSKVG